MPRPGKPTPSKGTGDMTAHHAKYRDYRKAFHFGMAKTESDATKVAAPHQSVDQDLPEVRGSIFKSYPNTQHNKRLVKGMNDGTVYTPGYDPKTGHNIYLDLDK